MALILLENGADREARDSGGQTPLFEAVIGHQAEFISAMLSAEAADVGRLDGMSLPFDVNAVANDGTTLLMAAVESTSFEIVHRLVDTGADITVARVRGGHRETAIMLAERRDLPAVASVLRMPRLVLYVPCGQCGGRHPLCAPVSNALVCDALNVRVRWEVVADRAGDAIRGEFGLAEDQAEIVDGLPVSEKLVAFAEALGPPETIERGADSYRVEKIRHGWKLRRAVLGHLSAVRDALDLPLDFALFEM